ncbi:bifunctional chorismate mutase/prephenate dehydratase [Candidatus Parcubacteria bacterium]|nr:MAG: bifunctional chorismate mutase/prephenate dehydratase [Candidatus Parcubacteria bacterium]
MKIGFQGIEGSYSQQALLEHLGKKVDSIGFRSFEDVFLALEKGDIDKAFLPAENSIAGSVAPVFDLLLKKDFHIYSETFLKINHCVLAKKGNTLEKMKKVLSHPVALEQCRDFIERNKLIPVREYDTAGSALMISESEESDVCAIASPLCKRIYDLDILEENISTNLNNFTRFFVIGKEKVYLNETDKTSIVFKPKRSTSYGALVNTLDIFSKYEINLTRVESRPDPNKLWEYVFYIDIAMGENDKKLKKAMLVLADFTEFIKILGSYCHGEILKK